MPQTIVAAVVAAATSNPPRATITTPIDRNATIEIGEEAGERHGMMTVETKAGPNASCCRFFNTSKGCQFGAHCRYRHVIEKNRDGGGFADFSRGSCSTAAAASPDVHDSAARVDTSLASPGPGKATSSAASASAPGSSSKSILCRYFMTGTSCSSLIGSSPPRSHKPLLKHSLICTMDLT
jgi:hypothetical protein